MTDSQDQPLAIFQANHNQDNHNQVSMIEDEFSATTAERKLSSCTGKYSLVNYSIISIYSLYGFFADLLIFVFIASDPDLRLTGDPMQVTSSSSERSCLMKDLALDLKS